MTTSLVVLDSAAFDVLTGPRPPAGLRALLRRNAERGGWTRCAAVTLAEVCRGSARTRTIEAALARSHGGERVQVVPTDERFAKLVGAILHQSGSGSERMADAHVAAVCSGADVAVVLTEDPGDIAELAGVLPGCRVMTRHPSAPLAG